MGLVGMEEKEKLVVAVLAEPTERFLFEGFDLIGTRDGWKLDVLVKALREAELGLQLSAAHDSGGGESGLLQCL